MRFESTGVIPAIVTPKNSEGEVAFEQIKEIVDFLFSKGVDGLHVCGSTGEFASLTTEERKRILEECVKWTKGRGTILAHVGSVSTKEACELAKHAKETGADAISSVPPFYYPVNASIVKNYYRRIAESSGLPVIIYDNPRTTGFTVTPEIAEELAKEEVVHGIKIARADMYALARFADINGGNFVVYPVETFYLAGLATADFVGTIGSMANWIPEAFVGIKRNFEKGNMKRAAELQRLICQLINAYSGEEIACTKFLLSYRGITCGEPWEPLLPLTEKEKESLLSRIDSFNINFDLLLKV